MISVKRLTAINANHGQKDHKRQLLYNHSSTYVVKLFSLLENNQSLSTTDEKVELWEDSFFLMYCLSSLLFRTQLRSLQVSQSSDFEFKLGNDDPKAQNWPSFL